MNSIQDHILDRIRGQGRGRVFTPKDFLDLGSRDAADQSLSRLVRGGEIQRLGRGLYYFPRMNQRLGIPIGPDPDEIAEALARQTGSLVVPSGAVAANRLGLSAQVPAKPVYLTNGRTREVKIGTTTFRLQHAAPKDLGQVAVDDRVLSQLRGALSVGQLKELLRDASHTTDWIGAVVRKVIQPEGTK